ncbi:MAG TPA: hypothetical protein VKR06_01525 [Ktedonosporobacter sp.]|nr:hypothetical protein [Ktedonosporobacter sp.]
MGWFSSIMHEMNNPIGWTSAFILVLLLIYIFSSSYRKKRTCSLAERSSDSLFATSSRSSGRTSRSVNLHSAEQPSRVNREQNQALAKLVHQARVRTALAYMLSAAPTTLSALLRHRAITLYQEQEGCTWLEASRDIDELIYSPSWELDEAQTPGVDPAVTFLLLRGGYVEDAVAYFRQGSGAATFEAIAAVRHVQRDIDTGNTHFLETGTRPLNMHGLQFLLEHDHKLIAIRYYRDCIGVNLLEAKEAINSL